MSGFRRPVRPVVPGEICPAVRTNSSRDPLVTKTLDERYYNEGVRTHCGRCGLPNVNVRQSKNNDGHVVQSWYYATHTVPTSIHSDHPKETQ